MPQATLAAVVIAYSIGLIEPAEFRAILKIRRTEFTWAFAAFTGVVALGTLKGIIVAIRGLGCVGLAYQVADPPVYVLGRKLRAPTCSGPVPGNILEDETFSDLLLLRWLEGRVFFLNAEHIAAKIRKAVEEAKPRIVVIDFSAVSRSRIHCSEGFEFSREKTARSRVVIFGL